MENQIDDILDEMDCDIYDFNDPPNPYDDDDDDGNNDYAYEYSRYCI